GLLVTANDGKDFSYVCETEVFGRPAGGFVMDPLLEVAPDGSIVTGSVQAARASVDGGCGFETIASLPRNFDFFGEEPPDGAEAGRVIDVCRRGAGASAPLLALVALVDETGLPLEHRIYEARNGTDFAPLGVPIPAELLAFATTLDAAPSDPARLYVSGTLANAAVLARSLDGAESWDSVPISAADADGVLGTYLAGVAPSDPDRVIVRASRRTLTENGYYVWDDSLLVSDDGGDAFFEVVRRNAALLGFAFANDGETLLAGYGDPRTDPALSLPEELGIYAAPMAPANELTFERIVADVGVSCLYATPSGLYVCATETDPLGVNATLEGDFHLGFHAGSSLPASRADFTPLLKLRDVRGPAVTLCDPEWQRVCAQFFACDNDPRELSDGALLCGEGDAGAGGHGGGDAGAGGHGVGGAGAGGRGDAETDATSGDAELGCGCRAAAGARTPSLVWTFAFLVMWWHKVRSKCRRSSF
ncbi:MAG TPA: hypothetical protein VMS65_07240, partial [Polyangiaceae bacterium]|nr:hypothetical protein [Polyangiaceae bacterium]